MYTRQYRYNILAILASFDPIEQSKKIIELSEKLGIEFYDLQNYLHSRIEDEDFHFNPEQIIIIKNVLGAHWKYNF